VRRVTGKSLGTFVREELAEPLGADFHIGTGPECDDRVALLIPPNEPGVPTNANQKGFVYKTFANPRLGAEQSWEIPWRRAEIPAANGHGNARSVAQIQSIVSHGGERNGRRFISEATLARIFDVQTKGEPDLILGLAIPMGIGYGLITDEFPVAPSPHACFWGGWGGSLVVNDLANRMTIAFVMNRMGKGTTGDARGAGIAWAAYEGLR
jgi:CubicO group peptidase (beta-lactamase class C family)